MPDARLIELVDGRARFPFSGEAYRHLGPGYQPISGEGARIHGGRWNPPESFPTLYMAIEKATAVAEFYRRAEREGMRPQDLLPRRLYRYRVELEQLLDLSSLGALSAVSLSLEEVSAHDPAACQAVGDAAHYSGFEGILASSATGAGQIIAVFFDRLGPDSVIEQLSFKSWDVLPGSTDSD